MMLHKTSSAVCSGAALAALVALAGCCCPKAENACAKASEKAVAAKPSAGSVRLLLPPRIYAAPGVETNIYFDNIVLVVNPDNYVFEASAPKGRCDEKRWSFTPGLKDVGAFPVRIRVFDTAGLVAEGSVTVEVSSADAGKGRELSILVVGDSLTNASVYPGRILEQMNKPGNPKLHMIGTHAGSGREVRPGGVAHEGYGGWTVESFLPRWTGDAAYAKLNTRLKRVYARSPFLTVKNGKPELDVQAYLNRMNGGRAPDIITVQLGVNDIFAATDANVEATIAKIFKNMDTLLGEFRKVAPRAAIGVGVTTPGARSQDAFGSNYQSKFFRWQYRKNQHRLAEAMIAKFAASNPYGVELVPSYLALDCEHNFPVRSEAVNGGNAARVTRQSNGVHPAPAGYCQIGDGFYSWIKSVMARKK